MDSLPWIIFKLKDNYFALNSSLVSGIQSLPPITPVPEIPSVFKGVCNIRGEVIPLADLRALLSMSSVESDRKAILDIVSAGKNDYAQRIEACEDWILAGRKTEPRFDVTDLAFTRWLADGGCTSAAAMAKFRALDTLKDEYLETVKQIIAHMGDNGLDRDGERLFRELREDSRKRLLSVFDSAAEIIDDGFTEMIITLSKDVGDQTPYIGVTVDEVHSVDQIELLDQQHKSGCLFISDHVAAIAKSDKIPGQIIVLNEQEILKLVKVYNDSRDNAENKA